MIITAVLENWELARRLAKAIVEESKRQALPLPDSLSISGPPHLHLGLTISRDGCSSWVRLDAQGCKDDRYSKAVAGDAVSALGDRVGDRHSGPLSWVRDSAL